ncbi:hypothetical protein RB195_001084 [Necator americanus]|uniref:Uncharacterized protein n=1 Tax=Necator americanus TaxID=51031 RepID=A0ABR1DD44_NECAM
MSDASNSFSAWETLPEDEPPLCIAAPLPESPPRHYEAVNLCGGSGDDDQESDNYTHSDSWVSVKAVPFPFTKQSPKCRAGLREYKIASLRLYRQGEGTLF